MYTDLQFITEPAKIVTQKRNVRAIHAVHASPQQDLPCPGMPIMDGDAVCVCISAASIIAKVGLGVRNSGKVDGWWFTKRLWVFERFR